DAPPSCGNITFSPNPHMVAATLQSGPNPLRHGDPRNLHSFPTRRSSDLARQPRPAVRQVLGRPRDAAGGADRRRPAAHRRDAPRLEEHTSELQSGFELVCRPLLEKKNVRGLMDVPGGAAIATVPIRGAFA